MRLHSYVVEHDQGFAPNPFWGVCTMANCKPVIRRTAEVGDLLLGTGSATVGKAGHLIYWMRVSEIMTFDEYWQDVRFRNKKPVMNGSRMQRFGDNIYHTAGGEVVQVDSFHSEGGGILSEGNLLRDTGSTDRVLVGGEYAYFGASAREIPALLAFAVKAGPGHKNCFSDEQAAAVEAWLTSLSERGLAGRPCLW